MRKLAWFLTSIVYFLSAKLAFGVDDTISLNTAQGNFGIGSNTTLGTIVKNSVTLIFTIAAVLVLTMLIWGGIEWVLSGGDKEKVANARKRIIGSLIGMAIVALAFLIVRVIGGIVGFDILTNLQVPSLNKL